MRRSSLHHPVLCGLLAAWMIAMLLTPLWHLDHQAPSIREPTSPHNHGVGAYLCDPGDPTLGQVDCALCAGKRQFSKYWTRVPAGAIAPRNSGSAVSITFLETAPGLSLLLPARAPPLC